MKQNKVYLNGRLLSLKEAGVALSDRGLLYGDGVFESLRTFSGQPFQLEAHLKRLLRSAKGLKIRGLPSAAKLKSALQKTLKANKNKESYIKIIITRGSAKHHGLDPKNAAGSPTLIIIVEPQKAYPSKLFRRGWKAIISRMRKADLPTARIKSLNYLDNILAKQEANLAGANEALLLDTDGNLAEGTISNVFIVKHGTIYTPPKSSPILPGLTRELVIKLAKESAFKIVEKNLTPKELYTADECFITFSGPGIVPITKIWRKKVGSGQPGYVTESLLQLYQEATSRQ